MRTAVRSTLERIGYKLSPKMLNVYSRCPRMFQMKYLRNVKVPRVFSASLAIGVATHNALAELFGHVRDGEPITSVESYATTHLNAVHYPAETATKLRAEHLPIVVDHMERAIDLLPRPADVLHVEKPFTCPIPQSLVSEPARFSARVDLVIRHRSTGVVDHIDFKTGATPADMYQNVVSRMVVAHDLDLRGSQLRTINLLTKGGEYREVPSGRDDLRLAWPSVRDTVVYLATDSTWVAASDPNVCRWCEFNKVCDSAANETDDHDC